MPLRKPLVLVSGQIQQISSSDTLDAVVSEVDIVTKANGEASAVVIGNAVYVFSGTQIKKGQANALGTSDVLGLMKDVSVAAAASGSIQTDGILTATTVQWDAVTGASGGLTPGSVYYLDPTTSGRLTVTAPSTVGQQVVRIGKALSTTEMDISCEPPIGL